MKKMIFLIPYQKMTEDKAQQIFDEISGIDSHADIELSLYDDEYELCIMVDKFSRKYKNVIFLGNPELIDRVDSENVEVIFEDVLEKLKLNVCRYINNVS